MEVTSMFLFVPEVILRSKNLSGDEKLILSMVFHLQGKGRSLFASDVYLTEMLGLPDPFVVIGSLIAKKFLIKDDKNYVIPPKTFRKIAENNGKGNIHKRDS